MVDHSMLVPGDKNPALSKIMEEDTITQYQNELEKYVHYRTIVDSSDDMIWSVDPVNYGLLTFNSALINYFKSSRGIDIKPGMTVKELLPEDYVDLWNDMYEKALKEGSYSKEYQVVAQNTILLLSFYPQIVSNEMVGISVFGKNITAYRLAENKMRESEMKLQGMLDNMLDAFFQVDLDGNITYVNPAALSMYGYSSIDEIIGLPASIFYAVKEERDELIDNLRKFGKKTDWNGKGIRKDGTTFWASMNAQVIRDNSGTIIGTQGVARDITERKQADEERLMNEVRFRELLENSLDASYKRNLQTNSYEYLSPAFERISGYTMIEFNNLPLEIVMELIHPDDRDEIDAMMSEVMNSAFGTFHQWNYRLKHKDGHYCWLNDRFMIKQDEQGCRFMIGCVSDITERKKMEEKVINLNHDLQIYSERLVLATRSAKLGVWDWDIVKNVLVWDDGMYNLYNIQHDDFSGAYEAWAYHIHPDDKEQVEKAIQEALRGEKEYAPEFRIVWPDGAVHHLRASSQTFYDTDGKPLRMVGINWDITEHKLMERHLYDSLDQTQRILTNLQDAYFQADLSGKFTVVNPNAAKMYGFDSVDEMIGLPAASLYSDSRDREKLIHALKEYGSVNDYYCEGLRKDGSSFWVSMNVQFVKNIDGGIIGTEGLVRDISERKKAEMEIKLKTERYQALIESTNDWVWIVDSENYNLTLFNAAVANYFKKNHNITLKPGMTTEEMLSENRRDLWKGFYKKAVSEGRFSTEYQTVSENLHFILSLAPLVIDEVTVGVSIFAKNITKEAGYKTDLEMSNQTLSKRLNQTIDTISKIGELRDVYTAGHQKRVAQLACAIALELGLTKDDINNISFGALIHDIGKIYIPSDILNKPGRISNLEYRILQTHAEHSYEIVKEIDFQSQVIAMIHQHHERLDGSGYPLGLSGDQIILESRILAVSDVVEAMSSHRPYRPSLGLDAALEEISMNKGSKFDDKAVDACIRLFKEQGFQFSL